MGLFNDILLSSKEMNSDSELKNALGRASDETKKLKGGARFDAKNYHDKR